MKKKGTVFIPYASPTNKYVEIMISLLERNGCEIYKLSDLKKYSVWWSCNIVYLNWYENMPGNCNYLKSLFIFIKKILILILLKLFGGKIIWTMHNKRQHDLGGSNYNQILFTLLVYLSNRIIVHSKESRYILFTTYPTYKKRLEAKIKHIPHPNYINIYGEVLPSVSFSDNKLHLLFIGQIKPYKNIELLIDVVKSFNKEDVLLNIVGKASSDYYRKKLENQISGFENISFDFRFIPDTSIPGILRSCDLLVLPYDISSSLNSGTVILAFSYKKTVICPEIGTIIDLKNKESVFSYRYSSKEEHFSQLKENIQKVILLKKENANILNHMGNDVYNQISSQNSKEIVQTGLKEIYSEMLR